MKIRPLPDIDLARIAPQPEAMKRKSLEQVKGGRPPFSYRPSRSCHHDILNVQPDLFGPVDPTPWAVIEEKLARRCRSDVEFENNFRVARGLYDFASSGRIMGRKHEFFPLAMGVGHKVVFWLPMILALEGKPHAIFVDPRRNLGLNAEGRRFVFSMMHERIRAADEDFADLRLAIVRFGEPEDDRRDVKLYADRGVDLFSLDELETIVTSTYEMWREVLEEREQAARRNATGTGPLI